MNSNTIESVGTFLLAVPQGIVAVFQLLKLSKGARMPSRKVRIFLAVLLVVGTALAVGLGGYLIGHPIQQPSSQVTAAPCPANNTGNTGSAEAKSGKQGTSIAHSGHGDTINVPAASKDK